MTKTSRRPSRCRHSKLVPGGPVYSHPRFAVFFLPRLSSSYLPPRRIFQARHPSSATSSSAASRKPNVLMRGARWHVHLRVSPDRRLLFAIESKHAIRRTLQVALPRRHHLPPFSIPVKGFSNAHRTSWRHYTIRMHTRTMESAPSRSRGVLAYAQAMLHCVYGGLAQLNKGRMTSSLSASGSMSRTPLRQNS